MDLLIFHTCPVMPGLPRLPSSNDRLNSQNGFVDHNSTIKIVNILLLLFLVEFLDSDLMATFIYAVVNSRMDYCNIVLAGAPRTVTDKLQRVLNTAVRLITALVRYCMTNCIGLTFLAGFSSSLHLQFTSV